MVEAKPAYKVIGICGSLRKESTNLSVLKLIPTLNERIQLEIVYSLMFHFTMGMMRPLMACLTPSKPLLPRLLKLMPSILLALSTTIRCQVCSRT